MTASEQVDVVIVGARCAGAATAMLLAQRGHRVLVLDRARKGSDTLSTHALMPGGVLQLRRWGLLDEITSAGTPAIRKVWFHYGDRILPVSIKPGAAVDALYAPRRTLLDRVLADAAVAAGARVRFGVSVTGLARDSDGRVVGVVGRDRDGGQVRVHSRLTIGADGIRSLVAREAGAATVRTGEGSGAIIYGYWPGLDATAYEWFYRPGGSAGLIPTNAGEVCVFAGTSTQRFQREIAGDIRAGYQRILKEVVDDDRLATAEAPRRLRSFPGRPAYARRPWGVGWALVGDAGQYLDPLSSHGMTDALRDAELLAESADAALNGDDEAVAMAAYEHARDRVAVPIFTAVDQLAGYRWSLLDVRRIVLELNAAMRHEVDVLSNWPDHPAGGQSVGSQPAGSRPVGTQRYPVREAPRAA